MVKNMKFCGQDEKIRKYLLPNRLLWKSGRIDGEDALFREKDLQIFTNEPDCMVMENTDDGTNAAVLLDFGVEFSGGVRILTEMCSGNMTPDFRLTFGESAMEAMSDIGYKNSTNDHFVRDLQIKLTTFSDMEFCQTGFRFARLELLSPNVKVRIKSIIGVFAYRDLEYQGSFVCSDETLNRIYDVAAYTCHLNMQNMLWDGVKRDRLVWIGDMHPEMLTIRTVFGYHKCIEEGLDFSIRKCPLPDYPNHMVTYAMWWLMIAKDWYMHNGNDAFLKSHRDYILNLTEQLCSLVDDEGKDALGQYDTGYFLDWPNFGKETAVPGVRALFSLALRAASALCDMLGAAEISALAERKAAVLTEYSSGSCEAKASAALMMLAGHMEPQKGADEVLLQNGAKGFSTFMSYYQLTALAKAGRYEEALSILKTYYGGMLAAGATTFWEDFDIDWLKEGARIDRICQDGEYDIHGDNGAHCYIGYRHSLCHGWSSGPTAFLAEQVLGIEIVEPGCKTIRLTPHLGGLQWAKGTYPTPYGILSVSHVMQPDGTVKTEYQAPKEITVLN